MVWRVWHVWHVWEVWLSEILVLSLFSEFLYGHNNTIMVQNFIFYQTVSFIGAFQSKLPANKVKK